MEYKIWEIIKYVLSFFKEVDLREVRIITPENDAVVTFPLKIEWTEPRDASEFEIEIKSVQTAEIINSIIIVDRTSLTISSLLEHDVEIKVRSINRNLRSDWSAPVKVKVDVDEGIETDLVKPRIITPGDSETIEDETVTFTWSEVQNATGYILHVSAGEEMVIDTHVESLSHSVILPTGTTYYWRVKAVQGSSVGPWSTLVSFNIEQPDTAPQPDDRIILIDLFNNTNGENWSNNNFTDICESSMQKVKGNGSPSIAG